MRVAIIHNTLSSFGGGERVCLGVIEALNEHGITPDVFLTSPANTKLIKKLFGARPHFRIRSILPGHIPALGVYQRLLTTLHKLNGYDLTISTSGPIPQNTHITYVYTPITSHALQPIDMPKYANPMWRVYYIPYQLAVRHIIKTQNPTYIAVSKWTQQRLKHYWGVHSRVIYPPIDTEIFKQAYDGPHKHGVLTLGRFSPEKNHMLQLQIAQQLPEIQFHICGSARTIYARRYYNKIKAKTEEMNLKNVELHPNIPLKKLLTLMQECKIFLHTFKYEDFGIVTVEAEAAGLIPIVPNYGGNRETVPYANLRYDHIDEACRLIKKFHISNGKKITQSLHYYAQLFGKSRFKKEIMEVILCLAKRKS